MKPAVMMTGPGVIIHRHGVEELPVVEPGERLDHAPVQERHDGQPAAEDERPRRREVPPDGPEHPDRNADGRFLPRDYAVQYWQAGTGRLLRTETLRRGKSR